MYEFLVVGKAILSGSDYTGRKYSYNKVFVQSDGAEGYSDVHGNLTFSFTVSDDVYRRLDVGSIVHHVGYDKAGKTVTFFD